MDQCIEITCNTITVQLMDEQCMADLIEGLGKVEDNGVFLVTFLVLHLFGSYVYVAQESLSCAAIDVGRYVV